MPMYAVVVMVLLLVVSGCATDMPSTTGKARRGGIDVEVKELTANLVRHCTTLTTNGVDLTYGLVCPVFGDETVAVYEDVPPAGASANDTLSIRIEHRREPLGTIADRGLDAVFDEPGELQACRIGDPLKVRERYMYVVGRLNELYSGHRRKRPGDHSPFEPPAGHGVTRDPN